MGYRPCTKDKHSLSIATGQRQKKHFAPQHIIFQGQKLPVSLSLFLRTG